MDDFKSKLLFKPLKEERRRRARARYVTVLALSFFCGSFRADSFPNITSRQKTVKFNRYPSPFYAIINLFFDNCMQVSIHDRRMLIAYLSGASIPRYSFFFSSFDYHLKMKEEEEKKHFFLNFYFF